MPQRDLKEFKFREKNKRKNILILNFLRLIILSNGQAITALYGIKNLKPDEPLTISACDHGMLFNSFKFKDLLINKRVDIIVWACKWHPPALDNPNMYSWIKVDNSDFLIDISLKKAFNNMQENPFSYWYIHF